MNHQQNAVMRCGQSPMQYLCSSKRPDSPHLLSTFSLLNFIALPGSNRYSFLAGNSTPNTRHNIRRLVGLDSLFVRASSKKLHSLFVGTFRTLGQITSATLAINYRS